jgi:hypothetical protein
MKGRISVVLLLVLLVLLVTGASAWWLQRDGSLALTGRACRSAITIIAPDNNRQLRIGIAFDFFSSEQGRLTIRGYLDAHGRSRIVERHVSFRYRLQGDQLTMVSERIRRTPADTVPNVELHNLLPSIYLTPGADEYYQFYRQAPDGFIIVREFVPLGYCKLE